MIIFELLWLVRDIVLAPVRFAAYLEGGWRSILRMALVVTGVIFAAPGWVIVVLAGFVLLGIRGLLVALILAPIITMLFAGLYIMSSGQCTLVVHCSFWIMRCQSAVTPVLSLFLMLIFSTAFPQFGRSPIVALLFLVLPGIWFGGGLPARLVFHPGTGEAVPVRWLLAVGALIIGGVLWWSPLRMREAALFIPCCAGLALAMLPPLSYLWEVPLALVLSLARACRTPAARLLEPHPTSYSKLCLLPLPSLHGLFVHVWANTPGAGVDWLLRLARHQGPSGVAGCVLDHLIGYPQLAHPMLLQLGTKAAGAALLRNLAERSWNIHPLLAAHAAFANTTDPAAWPAVIERHRPALAQTNDWPGGIALLALLDTAAGILGADRWPAAVTHLGIAPIPHNREIDAVCARLDQLQSRASVALSTRVADHEAVLPAPDAQSQDLESWPARLVAAMREHLLFLLALDRRRASGSASIRRVDRVRENEDTAPGLCLCR